MDQAFLQLYMDSSNALIEAMKYGIQLIKLDGQILREDINIKSARISEDSKVLTNGIQNRTLFSAQRIPIVQALNENLKTSCSNIVSFLQNVITQNSQIGELALAQKQLSAIMEFIKREPIKKDVDLSAISSDIMQIIISITTKVNTANRPQYELILKYMTDILKFTKEDRE